MWLFDSLVILVSFLVLQLASHRLKKVFSSLLEVGVAKYILGGVFAGFVEAVHVELPDEGVNVPVPKKTGQNLSLKGIGIPNRELFSWRKPVYDMMELRILSGLRLTSRISYVFLMKRATLESALSVCIIFCGFLFLNLKYGKVNHPQYLFGYFIPILTWNFGLHSLMGMGSEV